MALLQSFKLVGTTTADVALTTVDITVHSDGFLRFDSAGNSYQISLFGPVGRLIKDALTGTGGLASSVMG